VKQTVYLLISPGIDWRRLLLPSLRGDFMRFKREENTFQHRQAITKIRIRILQAKTKKMLD